MMENTKRRLRLAYTCARGIAHLWTRKPQSPTSPMALIADAATIVAASRGSKSTVVFRCDQCRMVATVELDVGKVLMVTGQRGCPVLEAWAELVRKPLPRARMR